MTLRKLPKIDDRFGLALLLAAMLVFAGCSAPSSAPAAPAAEEAPAAAEAAGEAHEAATEAAAAVAVDIEAPEVNPAGQAQEATAQPGVEVNAASTPETSPATGTTELAAGIRSFRVAPEQSRVQYQVEEEFFGQPVPFVTTVGTTQSLTGDVTLAFADDTVAIQAGQFTVDLTTVTSDRPRRDQAIRERWLESSKYPLATFAATGVTNLPPAAALGVDVPFQVAGDLTVREVTRPVTWDMTARIDGDTLTGSAQTFLLMKDFGFDPPSVIGILQVTDGVTVTVDFVATEMR